ncbi:NAD(P)-binding protein [Laetiporus sulphureus 93-53]|uniref:NAD(P)-binding protein n=1 Tax=Laetiporus sulphureus 93-53 TaxID=1314785 RepID=A0A165FBU8_9APHY|nr:NAD(P)-binding protein [Laetiporus sulphureus 93-53]KZT08732.1 NAD(P)-binding protein [Laetiporus sulphureus 93-53]
MISDTHFMSTVRHDTYATIDPSKADLSGRIILITGASKGIGKAAAIAFAQAGVCGLALLARSDLSDAEASCMAAQRRGTELRVLKLTADTTKVDEIETAVQNVKRTFGRLDILINNAGAKETADLIGDSDPQAWWKVWEVNILGTYFVSRACLPLLIESDGDKTILNIGSLAALQAGQFNSAYKASKLALSRFTEILVAEYANKGIVSYTVHPGLIPTEMTLDMPDALRKVLLCDTVELAAHSLVWLVQERREWLNGRYVSCNWDMVEMLAKRQEIIEGDKLKFRLIM